MNAQSASRQMTSNQPMRPSCRGGIKQLGVRQCLRFIEWATDDPVQRQFFGSTTTGPPKSLASFWMSNCAGSSSPFQAKFSKMRLAPGFHWRLDQRASTRKGRLVLASIQILNSLGPGMPSGAVSCPRNTAQVTPLSVSSPRRSLATLSRPSSWAIGSPFIVLRSGRRLRRALPGRAELK